MRVTLIIASITLVIGVAIGYKLHKPADRIVDKIVNKTQTQIVERLIDGKVVERILTKNETTESNKVTPSVSKKNEYRVGVLLPVASELKLPTVTASRRLFSDVWMDASFDIRHKEALLGLSYEF